MPWICPECREKNLNELISCMCGYEILPQDNVKLENETNEYLDVFIILFPIIYVATVIFFLVFAGSFGVLLALISPVLFLLTSLASLFLLANRQGKTKKYLLLD